MDEQEGNVDRLLKARAKIDEELRQHKSLVTILFTDVVGSTEYFDRYGDTAGIGMLHRHSELTIRTTEEFQGRVIKTIGDSVMAEFAEPVLAVRAAMEFQRRLLALNQKLPERERIQLRVGINHGPAMRSGTDFYGDAVNLAARITKHTAPAQILVSRSVRVSLASLPDVHFKCLGKIALKGKADQEEVFEVIWTGAADYVEMQRTLTAALARGDLVSPGLSPDLIQAISIEPEVPPIHLDAAPGWASAVPTDVMPSSAPVRSGSDDEGRFPAGTVLAERYRILGLIGQGGMGEVYRANDLKLGQPVALKFLPAATAKNQQLLARFHAEVRIARQVSHPNVCRVYDIGEVDGSTFLSMEYVDGEDLRSLLRRIGRLPGDKAIEIARKLCAGLAAAHDKGVLHRDLKPANIMIDGRGQVLITDFGLAAMAGQLDGANVRDGTPAYMAPEQLAGSEVSVRSDVYALGLVLHEMFTGKRVFQDGSERATPISVSSQAKDIDPLVERVILRCLDMDPRNRPASALAVAAALPGGDPLAAALAAGETPTPGMVAAAGDTEGISVRAAGLWLALILVGAASAVALCTRTSVLRQTPFERPPAALEERARNLIQTLGYAEAPADSGYGFIVDTNYQNYAEHQETSAAFRDQLAKGQPALIDFWYRESPQSLVAGNVLGIGELTRAAPPPIFSGMVGLLLDPQGRLIEFDAVPPQVEADTKPARPSEPTAIPGLTARGLTEERQGVTSRAADWPALFTAAGLDMSRFTPVEPQWVSLGGFDTRAAWTGSYTHAPGLGLRVEAASWRANPVFFRVIEPWSKPNRMAGAAAPLSALMLVVLPIVIALLIVVIAFAAVLAWRNFHAGRVDVQGATRLAAFLFAVEMLEWVCEAHHLSNVGEVPLFLGGAAGAAVIAGLMWMLYLALEPYVRRRWPHILITWNRLLSGGFRDPLVGGHLLAGIALGIAAEIPDLLKRLTLEHYGNYYSFRTLNSLLGTRQMTGQLLSFLATEIGGTLFMIFLFFLLRVLLRRQWLAAVAAILLFGLFEAPQVNGHAMVILFDALSISLTIASLIWFGALPTVVGAFVGDMLANSPLTTDLSAWYAGNTVSAIVIVLALTAYAFDTAVAGRPLFKAGFLESD